MESLQGHPTDIIQVLRARFAPLARTGMAAWFASDQKDMEAPEAFLQMDVHFSRALLEFESDLDAGMRATAEWFEDRKGGARENGAVLELAPPACAPHVPRGVYSLPFRDSSGRELLVAIDRRCCSVGGATRVFDGEDVDDVADRLWNVLDELDPEGAAEDEGQD